MITLSVTARNAVTNAITAALSATPTPAKFKIYTADRATLLAVATCELSAFSPAANGKANLSAAIKNVPVIATGTAALFDIVDGNGVVHLSGVVGTTDGDLRFSSTNWAHGDIVDIESFTIAAPARAPQ